MNQHFSEDILGTQKKHTRGIRKLVSYKQNGITEEEKEKIRKLIT